MTMIEKLAPEVAALHQLLADPHPGLSTWQEMVRERWDRITALHGEHYAKCPQEG